MLLILVHILLDINEYALQKKKAKAKRQAWVKIAQQINASFPLVAHIRKECEKQWGMCYILWGNGWGGGGLGL